MLRCVNLSPAQKRAAQKLAKCLSISVGSVENGLAPPLSAAMVGRGDGCLLHRQRRWPTSALSIARTIRADARRATATRSSSRATRAGGSALSSPSWRGRLHLSVAAARAFIGRSFASGHAAEPVRLRSGDRIMKVPLLIALAVVVVAGSGLAIMNMACKSGHHAWCSQMSSIRHHLKHS